MVLLMSECAAGNVDIKMSILCSSPITALYAPKFLLKIDHGLIKKQGATAATDDEERYKISLNLDPEQKAKAL
jgi:hypothetical protein